MQLNRFIDHTLLKPEATSQQIAQLCDEAIQYKFYSVCVNSRFVDLCSKKLMGSGVKTVSVVGFPLGANSMASKLQETLLAIEDGAQEIDMVLSIGALKEQNWDYVKKDIEAVVGAAGANPVKVIIETGLLTDEEKKLASKIVLESGAHFVKTCTGFNGGSATIADVKLIHSVLNGKIQIKASGGIKNAQFAREIIEAGATRLGTSSGIQLVENKLTGQGDY